MIQFRKHYTKGNTHPQLLRNIHQERVSVQWQLESVHFTISWEVLLLTFHNNNLTMLLTFPAGNQAR